MTDVLKENRSFGFVDISSCNIPAKLKSYIIEHRTAAIEQRSMSATVVREAELRSATAVRSNLNEDAELTILRWRVKELGLQIAAGH